MPRTEYAVIPEATTGQDVTRAAIQALKRFRHDRNKATAALTMQIKGNAALRAAAVELGIRTAIMTASSETRRQLFVAASADEPEHMADTEAAQRAASVPFLDSYSLYGGKVLGDATASDVRESATSRRAQAATQIKRAAFEDAVAKAVKGNKTVRECMKDAYVASLAAVHKIRA